MKPKSRISWRNCVTSIVCPTFSEMLLSSRTFFETTSSAIAEGSLTMYSGLDGFCSRVSTSVRRISFAASFCPYFT